MGPISPHVVDLPIISLKAVLCFTFTEVARTIEEAA